MSVDIYRKRDNQERVSPNRILDTTWLGYHLIIKVASGLLIELLRQAIATWFDLSDVPAHHRGANRAAFG